MISIHAPREGSDWLRCDPFLMNSISIHAPREGSDPHHGSRGIMLPISIHAPREGSDRTPWMLRNRIRQISIHAPREGSDGTRNHTGQLCVYFYPRSPRGERRPLFGVLIQPQTFLSTLPARGATKTFTHVDTRSEFLSTLPARGATKMYNDHYNMVVFLSTLPARGATSAYSITVSALDLFLSTLPARGATAVDHAWRLNVLISIHAPREGSDSLSS